MSEANFAARDLVIHDQTLVHADIEPAAEGVEQPAIAWGVGILAAPPGTETTTPYALVSIVTVTVGNRTFRAQHLVTVAAGDERIEDDDAALDALWDECLRRFGRVLWRTGLVAIRQLAAVAEADLTGLADSSIEPKRISLTLSDPAEANPTAEPSS